jgi:predicted adenylyl cyclase CyaB
MPRNVEIKARIRDMNATRRLVAAAAVGGPVSLSQTDTFFRVGAGRLKLRESSAGQAELIYYQRPDTPGPSESHYERVAVSDGPVLRELLTAALGACGQVRKRRLVYRVGRTRVHLDQVEGLGDFLELEVELEAEDPVDAGAGEARRLMRLFGVQEDALVPEAYVDLLTGRDARRT